MADEWTKPEVRTYRITGPEYVLRVMAFEGWTDGDPRALGEEAIGKYVVSYDPDAYDGRGYATWTDDLAEALRFPTPAEALVFYQRTSTVLPIRPWDGKPNRPLTAYSLECAPVSPLAD